MHKKSIEAAKKLKEEDFPLKEGKSRDRDELRTESINILRAKAQEHSAKIIEAIGITPANQAPLPPLPPLPHSQHHHHASSQNLSHQPHTDLDHKSLMSYNSCQAPPPLNINCLS